MLGTSRGLTAIGVIAALSLTGVLAAGCGDGDDSTESSTTQAGSQQQTLKAFITTDFERDDQDGDGSLDEAEATAAIDQDFAASDVDGDGTLTIDDVQQELRDTGGGKADKPLAYYLPYDGNGDGRITKQEYRSAVNEQLVKPMDENGDGEISLSEAIAFQESPPASGDAMRRLALASVLGLLLSAAFSGTALGSAFYNQSSSNEPNPAQLYFSCGVFCNNSFNIAPGGSASRPGKSGTFYLTNNGGFTGQGQDACELDERSVQDHGWGVLEYTDGTYQWNVYGDDQQPVSGSPFNIEFGIYNIDPERGPTGCQSP